MSRLVMSGSSSGLVVAVTGSRRLADPSVVWAELDRYDVAAVAHGDAVGADAAAGSWARAHGICEIRVPANWARLGRRAGPIRNQWIIDHVRPDLVLAFPLPGSVGTWHMVEVAQSAGVPVEVIESEDER